MKEFINAMSTNDKVIMIFSIATLSISITEFILFVIRFSYAVFVYQKRLPDHRVSGYTYINAIERVKFYALLNAFMSYFVVVFGINNTLILKGYIAMNAMVILIAAAMYVMCTNFGFMLKVNVNRKDYFSPRLSAYNPKDDNED